MKLQLMNSQHSSSIRNGLHDTAMKKPHIFSYLIYLLCLLSLAAFSAHAQTRRAMTAADTLRIAAVNDAQISPDGGRVVYTVATTEGNETRSTLWIVPATSSTNVTASKPAPLLPVGWNATNPRWSPDSKSIAFLATHDNQSGIWILNLPKTYEQSVGDSTPRFIAPVRSTNFFITYAGESFAWSPDSHRIAYISASKDTSDVNDASNSAARKESNTDDPRVINRIQYKSRTSFSDRARTHVWITNVEQPNPRQLTNGAYYDHAVTFNPRGDEIAYLSNHEPDPDAVNNSDIFAINTDGRTRQITNTKGCEYEPTWSPDGKLIAYTATKRPVTTIDSIAEDAHVWVIEASGGTGRELTAAQDRRARSPHWASDSRAVYFLAADRGQAHIYRVKVNGNVSFLPFFDNIVDSVQRAVTISQGRDFYQQGEHMKTALPPNQISNFSVSFIPPSRSGGFATFAFTMSDTLHPAEAWFGSPFGDVARRISSHNDAVIHSLDFIESEEINFKSFDGTPIQGWLMKPLDFKEGGRYPLILSVHGGPHGAYGYSFNPAFQVYAAHGYAVLYLNPRGSTGYGQKFSDGTIGEWGGGDYQDLMRGVDEVTRTRQWIDPNRLGVTGGSYGGFMTNWIITQTPRFRAAVASASVSNLVSFYATSLYQDLIHAEFNGFPWDNYETLWRWSPIRYVKQAQTPTLFLHGEQDNDVHITQAEEMYMALQRRGIETELVRYPREGHGLREPRHRVDALERTLNWFDKYLKQ